MTLFGHHMNGFLQIEIMGREFPDGPTEHYLAFAATVVVLVLVGYGAFAMVRDFLAWRKKKRV
jgi:hypothetical protein